MTTSPLPANTLRAEAKHGDLDARILQAEQRLIEREENLHRSIHALGLRVRQSLQPRRLLLPAVGVIVGILWLNRQRRRAAAQAQRATAAAARPRGHSRAGIWIPMVGLVWPMLPAAWRARVPPTLANLMLGTGLPLLEQLLAPPPLPPLATVGPIDRSRLAGVWYELGRLPAAGAGASPVRWRHTLREDGALDLLNERSDAQGKEPAPSGVAMAVAGSGGARWRVSHWPTMWRWLPMAWHQEAVLHLDDAATELVLGSPERDHLRLLARQPHLPRPRLQAMLAVAAERGFAVDRLHFSDQGPAAGVH